MGKLTPQAYSLLPRLDETFLIVRVVTFAGIGLWGIFVPDSALHGTPALIVLGLFAVHLLFFLFSISRKLLNFKVLYYFTLAFDLIGLTALIRFTGGFASDLFVLYYLFFPFAAYVLGTRTAVLTPFAATGLYLAANLTLPKAAFPLENLLYLVVLWPFCVGPGYYSNFLKQSEKRLLSALDKLNERTTELERAHSRLELVYDASRDLGAILEVGDLIERVLFISRNLFGYPTSEFFLWDRKEGKLFLRGQANDLDTVVCSTPRSVRLTPILKAVLESGQARRHAFPRRDQPMGAGAEGKAFRSQLAVPMIFQGKTIGILNAESSEINAFSERDEHAFSILANSAAMAWENAQLHGKMEQLTISDELTGIFNYRYFKARLEDERKRSVRYGQPLSLIMIDIDWFKRFNDTYGHETGNRLLKKIAQVISVCIRDVDILARYGGEEFIVILPQTGQVEAYKIGERVRKKIADGRFEVGPNGQQLAKVTVSVGISCYPENGRPEYELMESVDQALYQAKGAGKNLVCTI